MPLVRFVIFLCVLATGSGSILAQPPLYSAQYQARMKGMKAKAIMRVRAVAPEKYSIDSEIEIKLLGVKLAGLNERSVFTWDTETGQSVPLEYIYEQTGIGGRTRSAEFDHEAQQAIFHDRNGDITEMGLPDNTQDRVTFYFELRRQLEAGETDMYINVFDRRSIEQEHYRKIEESVLDTPLGRFNAVKVEKIREPESKRRTEIWLAKDWDYILLRLVQSEEGEGDMEITLEESFVRGLPVKPLP